MRLRKHLLKSSESINLKRGELLLVVHKPETELILLQIVLAVRHSTEVFQKENEQVRPQATDLKTAGFVRSGKDEAGGSHNWLLETFAVQCK